MDFFLKIEGEVRSAGLVAVWFALLEWWRRQGYGSAGGWVDVVAVAALAGVSRQTASRLVFDDLARLGLLTVVRKGKGKVLNCVVIQDSGSEDSGVRGQGSEAEKTVSNDCSHIPVDVWEKVAMIGGKGNGAGDLWVEMVRGYSSEMGWQWLEAAMAMAGFEGDVWDLLWNWSVHFYANKNRRADFDSKHADFTAWIARWRQFAKPSERVRSKDERLKREMYVLRNVKGIRASDLRRKMAELTWKRGANGKYYAVEFPPSQLAAYTACRMWMEVEVVASKSKVARNGAAVVVDWVAPVVELMVEDGRSAGEIFKVFSFCLRDRGERGFSGWRTILRDAAMLRAKWGAIVGRMVKWKEG